MPDRPPSAFISYSREDSEFALRLAQDLKAAGARVWLDQLELKPGLPWDNAIEDALLGAQQMLVILSPTSVRSENVRDEISYALRQGKVGIPVLYMDCTIPLRLERKQHIDCRTDYAGGLAKLLAELRVDSPNQTVLDRAAEDDARRQAAWQAREAEAQRMRGRADQNPRIQNGVSKGKDAEQQLDKGKVRITRQPLSAVYGYTVAALLCLILEWVICTFGNWDAGIGNWTTQSFTLVLMLGLILLFAFLATRAIQEVERARSESFPYGKAAFALTAIIFAVCLALGRLLERMNLSNELIYQGVTRSLVYSFFSSVALSISLLLQWFLVRRRRRLAQV